MRLPRILRTTAARLTLRYALLSTLLTTLGLSALYWATSDFVIAQIEASLNLEMNQLIDTDRQFGRQRLIARIGNEQAAAQGRDRRYYLLLAASGERLAGELIGWPENFVVDRRVHNVWFEADALPRQGPHQDGYWPTVAAQLADGSRLLVSQSIGQTEDLQEFILGTMATIVLVVLGLSLALGWFLSRALLERIDAINLTASQVGSGDLSRRVSTSPANDEFDELAGHLNRMLDRIEQLMNSLRQVTDNVAHDLRRPLTRIRGRIEVTLLEPRSIADYQRVLEETIEDAGGLLHTFNALLEIAQTEAGSFRGEWSTVDLSALLSDLADLYQRDDDAPCQCFTATTENGLIVIGNRHLLAQAVSNILDNAFKYSPADGTIRMSASRGEHGPRIIISDNGPGIPLELRTRVLGRFVRLEAERSTPGNGLGLSLAKAVVDLHKGELRLDDNSPGLRVSIEFKDGEQTGLSV